MLLDVTAFSLSNTGLKHILEASVLNIFFNAELARIISNSCL